MSTGSTPKISVIRPSVAPTAEAPKDEGVSAPSDAYETGSSDAFKGLVVGGTKSASFKADSIDPGVVSEMYDAQGEAQAAPKNRYAAMQNLLGNLMQGEVLEKFPKDILENIPYVPKYNDDFISKTSAFKNNKEPLVERYAALEKTLLTLLKTAEDSLVPQKMYDLSAAEIRSLQAYREKLYDSLAECRTQFKLAKKGLQADIEKNLEAAKGPTQFHTLPEELEDIVDVTPHW